MASSAPPMGDLLPYRPKVSRQDTTAWLGMVFFLASWAMMFGALFFSYAYVRAATSAYGWPPEGLPELPWRMPAASTVLLALSSAALHYGAWGVKRGRVSQLAPSWAVGVALGLGFLGLQTLTWVRLYREGLTVSAGGAYASVFYGLTWLHAAHVVVGLFGLVFVILRAWRGSYGPGRFLGVRLWGMYWHFVGAVWALMFVSVFLM